MNRLFSRGLGWLSRCPSRRVWYERFPHSEAATHNYVQPLEKARGCVNAIYPHDKRYKRRSDVIVGVLRCVQPWLQLTMSTTWPLLVEQCLAHTASHTQSRCVQCNLSHILFSARQPCLRCCRVCHGLVAILTSAVAAACFTSDHAWSWFTRSICRHITHQRAEKLDLLQLSGESQ